MRLLRKLRKSIPCLAYDAVEVLVCDNGLHGAGRLYVPHRLTTFFACMQPKLPDKPHQHQWHPEGVCHLCQGARARRRANVSPRWHSALAAPIQDAWKSCCNMITLCMRDCSTLPEP